MYRVTASVIAVVMLALVPLTALAQEKKEEVPRPYVYASYLECDPSQEWMADSIVETVHAPIYDAAVENGTITGWGWMAHHTGGKWRRLLYRVSPTVEGAVDATEKLAEKVNETNQQAARQVSAICSAHDDYIWRQVAGSSDPARGAAGFSVYMVCDMAKEERADELVKTILGPIYDKHVGEGKLTSWGWLSHVVGGKWRRLATMTAADHKTILSIRGKILEELQKNEVAMTEFSSICSSHQDYMWNIEHETP